MNFERMVGKTLTAVEVSDDKERVSFSCSDGSQYEMFHEQDCCETVAVNEIIGDLQDLIGSPLLLAEEVSSDGGQPVPEGADESWTWTFYKLATIKGSVTMRWLGESNGYYSESVDFVERKEAS